MIQTVRVIMNPIDRRSLDAIVADRNRPRKYVERARIVTVSGAGGPVRDIATEARAQSPSVWRWQQHFAKAARVGALTSGAPPNEATP